MSKYKTLIIIMFFLSIFTFSKVHAIVKDLPLLGKTIYLDTDIEDIDTDNVASEIRKIPLWQ